MNKIIIRCGYIAYTILLNYRKELPSISETDIEQLVIR